MAEDYIELKSVEDGLPVLPSSNGHPAEEPTLPRLDSARGVFITSRNEAVELSDKSISALMLERLANEGKPKIPVVEVTLMGKHKQLEAHPDDPGYKARLEEWEGEQRIRTLQYVYVMGVKGDPPADFVDDQLPWFPNASPSEMKYLWVASRIPDKDIDAFIEAVTGRMIPTQKGLEEVGNFTE